ncbi:hypothetical protein ACI5FR_08450 [Paenibacillus sp. HJGM_3]
MPDIVGLIAPKPLLVESGTDDTIFPNAASREAVSDIGRIYGLLHQQEKLAHDIIEGQHQISGSMAYDWLEKCCETDTSAKRTSNSCTSTTGLEVFLCWLSGSRVIGCSFP